MKSIILLFVLLFSTITYSAEQTIQDTDFAPFPLDVIEAMNVIEGVWRGEGIDLQIKGATFSWSGKPAFFVTMSDYERGKTQRGFMYYSSGSETYRLYVYRSRKSIPVDMGIFQFSGAYASDAGMTCKSGGALLRLKFEVEQSAGEILLTKESCL